jgi:hypothetical protein
MRPGKAIARGSLFLAGLAIALLVTEHASRLIQPIRLHSLITDDGRTLPGWLAPGTAYRQVSSEYDARTTITPEGHRVPAPRGAAELVFLGDSFTFGSGLADEETFAWIYCEAARRSCANLAEPGSGTARQVERLREFLDGRGWRPREVKLFVFAMTASFSAGNDLADNYLAAHDPDPQAPATETGWLERMLALRGGLERRSNLVRLAKYHWGPLLRSALVPGLDDARRDEALARTREALDALAQLARSHGFELAIYLLGPVQDVSRGTHAETLAALAAIAPVPVRPTAQLFADDPARYYFPLDGHLNPQGARAIADLLLREPRRGAGLR